MKKETAPVTTMQRAFPHMMPASEPQSLPGVRLESAAPSGNGGGPNLKRKGANEDETTNPQEEAKPGSKKDKVSWPDDEHMRIGPDIFAVVKYSKDKLGLDKDAALELCWPVLASRQTGERKLAFCPCHTEPAHKGLNTKAHRAPKDFDRLELVKSYSETAPGVTKKPWAKKTKQ